MIGPQANASGSTLAQSGWYCQRTDMSSPLLVFFGLFVAAIAICGTLESHAPAIIEEVRALNHENVVGPIDMDLVAQCGPNRRARSTDRHCEDRNILRASLTK